MNAPWSILFNSDSTGIPYKMIMRAIGINSSNYCTPLKVI